MKKKRIFVGFILIMTMVFVSGCGVQKSGKISVVCTNFAVYDWVTNIIDGYETKYDVELLAGGDIHSYQPTVQDIAKISRCDLFIYIGGVSDIWAEEIVKKNSVNSLKLSEVLKDDLLCEEEHHNHNECDFDEHIWLSLKMAEKSVDKLFEKLGEFTEGEEYKVYADNTDAYKERLDKLDGEYTEAVRQSKDKTIVFADRFPFLYMVRDYGIDCFAAFPGCSADSDADFGVIAELTKAVDEYKKETVLVLEKSKLSVAKTVIQSTKTKDGRIAEMNSCQSVSKQEIQDGTDYIEIMEGNLKSLKEALR